MFTAEDNWALGWDAVGSLVGIAAVVVSLVLLALQRGDIAFERSERRRQQARGVYLHASVQQEETDEGAYTLTGGQVQVSNHSSEPITIEACYAIHEPDRRDENWIPWRLSQTSVDSVETSMPRLLLPGQEVLWTQPAGRYAESFINGDSIVVEFRDARGVSWWKTSDDGEVQERYPQKRWMSRTSRIIASNTITLRTLLWWLAMGAVRNKPDGGPPLSWRCYLLLTGGMGPEASYTDEILDRSPPKWPSSPHLLPTTVFVLHPRQLAELGEEAARKWREDFDPNVPATWALGGKPGVNTLWAMIKDSWRNNPSLLPASFTLMGCTAGVFLAFWFHLPPVLIVTSILVWQVALLALVRRQRAGRSATRM